MPQTIYAELCYPQGYFVLIFLIESIMIVPICIYNTCIYSKYMVHLYIDHIVVLSISIIYIVVTKQENWFDLCPMIPWKRSFKASMIFGWKVKQDFALYFYAPIRAISNWVQIRIMRILWNILCVNMQLYL